MTDSNQDPGPEKPGAAGDWMMTFAARERTFLVVLLGCFLVAALSYQSPMLAMWVGFAFAGYSAVANDSIQTIGTFIASNREQKWWVLWIFIGGIFALTVANSWWNYGSGVEASYFANVAAMESGDEPVHEETYPDTGIDWTRYEPLDVEPPYAVHFEGRYLPERSGEHTFGTLELQRAPSPHADSIRWRALRAGQVGATEPFADTQPITLVAGEAYALSYDFAQFDGAEPSLRARILRRRRGRRGGHRRASPTRPTCAGETTAAMSATAGSPPRGSSDSRSASLSCRSPLRSSC